MAKFSTSTLPEPAGPHESKPAPALPGASLPGPMPLCDHQTLGHMKLNDKYTQQSGSVYLTGMQALVRLPMDQMRRDQLAGLNTATFISGYEGSPLGAYDLTLSRAAGLLKEHRIH